MYIISEAVHYFETILLRILLQFGDSNIERLLSTDIDSTEKASNEVEQKLRASHKLLSVPTARY